MDPGQRKGNVTNRKKISELSLFLDLFLFTASLLEEDTGKIAKGESGLAWENGKGCKCKAEMPSSMLLSVLRN